MELQGTCVETLEQLSDLLAEFDNVSYSKMLDLLSGNSVGKHVRHILEFYETMLQGVEAGEINYDKRQRDIKLETDVVYTSTRIKNIASEILKIEADSAVKLSFSYAEGTFTTINTTIYRELAYNIEHSVHHMAILKIAINSHFPHITLPDTFGLAYSTVQYQQKCAQ